VERFFGVLVEHYAGAFPVWLSPVQLRVLPVAENHEEYARSVVDSLRRIGARVDSVEAVDPLGKRIRAAKLEKIPYVLVVGDDDIEHGTVGVNTRDGSVDRGVSLTQFIEGIRGELSMTVPLAADRS
jgi:threonyl-tRNA synthetase